jgi:hypothetical protein
LIDALLPFFLPPRNFHIFNNSQLPFTMTEHQYKWQSQSSGASSGGESSSAEAELPPTTKAKGEGRKQMYNMETPTSNRPAKKLCTSHFFEQSSDCSDEAPLTVLLRVALAERELEVLAASRSRTFSTSTTGTTSDTGDRTGDVHACDEQAAKMQHCHHDYVYPVTYPPPYTHNKSNKSSTKTKSKRPTSSDTKSKKGKLLRRLSEQEEDLNNASKNNTSIAIAIAMQAEKQQERKRMSIVQQKVHSQVLPVVVAVEPCPPQTQSQDDVPESESCNANDTEDRASVLLQELIGQVTEEHLNDEVERMIARHHSRRRKSFGWMKAQRILMMAATLQQGY